MRNGGLTRTEEENCGSFRWRCPSVPFWPSQLLFPSKTCKHATNMLPTCHQHPPTPQEFAQFAGADGLKKLINCLWALTPEKRPTFRELQAAMAGDKEILQAFPGAFSGIGAS